MSTLQTKIKLNLFVYYNYFNSKELMNLNYKKIKKWVRNEICMFDPEYKIMLREPYYREFLKTAAIELADEMALEKKHFWLTTTVEKIQNDLLEEQQNKMRYLYYT